MATPVTDERAAAGTAADEEPTSPAQVVALLMGMTFALVGVLGSIPGVTADYGRVPGGDPQGGELLRIFEVNVLHNVVHLLFGLLGCLAALSHSASRTFLLVGGATYFVVWVYGVLVDPDADANFLALNGADNWLHLGLAVAMLGAGVVLGRRPAPRRAP